MDLDKNIKPYIPLLIIVVLEVWLMTGSKSTFPTYFNMYKLNKSHSFPIGIGVPQGLILGPYCISYMCMTLIIHARLSFMDDMTLLYIHRIQISRKCMKIPMSRSVIYIHGSILIDCR